MSRPPRLKALPKYGQLMSWDDFVSHVRGGTLIDYDGVGELATETGVSHTCIVPSEVEGYKKPRWATHVVWYNK